MTTMKTVRLSKRQVEQLKRTIALLGNINHRSIADPDDDNSPDYAARVAQYALEDYLESYEHELIVARVLADIESPMSPTPAPKENHE